MCNSRICWLVVAGTMVWSPSVAPAWSNPIPSDDECQFDPNALPCLEQVNRVGPAPFLAEGYVPQGVASSCEAGQGGRSCRYQERIFVSAYHKPPTPPSGTSPMKKRPSIIAEVLPTVGMTRCFLLNTSFEYSHAGGLAYWQNPAKPSEEYLFVSGNRKIARYRIPERRTPDKPWPETSFDCLDFPSEPAIFDVAASSFVSTVELSGKRHLLVGKYCKEKDEEEKYCKNGEIPYAYLYPLVNKNVRTERYTQKYKLPNFAQGADFVNAGPQSNLVVSQSGSLIHLTQYDSRIASCGSGRPGRGRPPGRSVCELMPRSPTLEFEGRAEDLASSRGRLWSVSESGARWFTVTEKDSPKRYNPYIFYTRPVSRNGTRPGSRDRARRDADWAWDAYTNPRRSDYVQVRNRAFQGYAGWYDNAERIWVMDVDGDNDDDIVIGPYSENGAWYLLRAEDGVFEDEGIWGYGYSGWYDNVDRIRVMDVDGDNDDDIVIGPYSEDGAWYVMLSTSYGFVDDGVWANAYKGWYDNAERIWVMDVDGDNDDDIVIGPYSKDGAWYLLRAEDGAFEDEGIWGYGYSGWYDNVDRIRVMDVDGDNDDDIVIGPYSKDGAWYVMLSTSYGFVDDGVWANAYKGWYDNPERIRVMDVDGDNDDDIVIGPYSEDGSWYVLRSTGKEFKNEGAWLRDYWGWYDDADRIRIMDANNDGREDILIGPKRHTGEWTLLQSSDMDDDVCALGKTGCFLPRTWAVDTLQGWWDDSERVRVMDINADGFDDIVVGPQSTGDWHVLQTRAY